jgi:flagellar biosynthesis GTPase FlhF
MRIKSYFANTVSDAVRSARREMGEEAMLVQTRPAPPESRHLGSYEVVFAGGNAEPNPAHDLAQPVASPLASGEMSRLYAEMAQMRRQLDAIRMAMRSGFTAPRWMPPSSSLAETFSTLLAAEVSSELAQSIVDRLHTQMTPAQLEDPVALARSLASEMASRITVSAALGCGDSSPRVVALVGPPGSGKTTMLVKLAVAHGVAARKTVQVLSLDNLRVGAAEQLRSYAAILGVGFQALDSPVGLDQALAGHRAKSLILIDTPGYCLDDLDSTADLACLLTRGGIDVHLVLTASMKSADLTRVVEAFEVFRPTKLLFTRLDETESFGPIFCEAARTRKALSFFGTGQRIPEDLQTASCQGLIGIILGDRLNEARQAA